MKPKFQPDFYFNQIYQIRQMALYFAMCCLCVFVYLDFQRFTDELLNAVLATRILYQLLPIVILIVASAWQKPKNIHKKQYYFLSAICVLVIGMGHAEILTTAYESGQYFPKVGMTIILFYAGILLALPIKFSAITSALIILSAAYAYDSAGLPYDEVFSITVFYAVFAACCVFMNYVCTKILRNNLILVKHINKQAHTDNLTKLCNRRYFFEKSEQIQKQSITEHKSFAVLLVDLDNFKQINDSMGHNQGDQVLIKVAEILTAMCRRPLDMSARFGGDEFVMLLYDCDEQHIKIVCSQIINHIEHLSSQLSALNPNNSLGVSVGVAINDLEENFSTKTLINMADKALYKVKQNGKNTYHITNKDQFFQSEKNTRFIQLVDYQP